MFNLFEFLFFALQFPDLPKEHFYSHWFGLYLQTQQGPGSDLRSDTGYPCQPWLWTWPMLTCSPLSMPGHGLEPWARISPLKSARQTGWKSECKM